MAAARSLTAVTISPASSRRAVNWRDPPSSLANLISMEASSMISVVAQPSLVSISTMERVVPSLSNDTMPASPTAYTANSPFVVESESVAGTSSITTISADGVSTLAATVGGTVSIVSMVSVPTSDAAVAESRIPRFVATAAVAAAMTTAIEAAVMIAVRCFMISPHEAEVLLGTLQPQGQGKGSSR